MFAQGCFNAANNGKAGSYSVERHTPNESTLTETDWGSPLHTDDVTHNAFNLNDAGLFGLSSYHIRIHHSILHIRVHLLHVQHMQCHALDTPCVSQQHVPKLDDIYLPTRCSFLFIFVGSFRLPPTTSFPTILHCDIVFNALIAFLTVFLI